MRNFYSPFLLISAVLVCVTFVSSCSENEEDVSAPTITIKKPIENDTIHLASGKVYIEVKAENNAKIDEMAMKVITQSGTVLYNYEESKIEKYSYTCTENFSCDDLYTVTKVKLIVTCENEFHAWRKKEVNFYITR